jgi:PKD repeat protein
MKDREIAVIGIITILLISLIGIPNSFFSDALVKKATANPVGEASETKWYVSWYLYENDEWHTIGNETWPEGSFHYDWSRSNVYEDYRDNIMFIANTPKIYSEGGTYEFRLYDVDDDAWVYLDGNEILSASYSFWTGDGEDSVEIPLSKGTHHLAITWIEDDGDASIGFYAPSKLFNLPPRASFGFGYSSLHIDSVIDFNDASKDSDGYIRYWSWDFGDGHTSHKQNPSHSYSYEETFTVTLTVTDNEGATNATIREIEIKGEKEEGIPGFEFAFLIIAIASIILLKRRNNRDR